MDDQHPEALLYDSEYLAKSKMAIASPVTRSNIHEKRVRTRSNLIPYGLNLHFLYKYQEWRNQ